MAVIAKLGVKVSPLFTRQRGIALAPFVRTNWNRDWQPGPYPQTEEERQAAAKKYGLRPEDYKPIKDDGLGAGDYPELPIMGPEARNPYDAYDLPEMRRNYGEPVDMNADMYAADRFDPVFVPRFPYWQQFLGFCAFFVLPFAIHLLTEDYPKFLPVLPKHYPSADGSVVHYTFEPITKKDD